MSFHAMCFIEFHCSYTKHSVIFWPTQQRSAVKLHLFARTSVPKNSGINTAVIS